VKGKTNLLKCIIDNIDTPLALLDLDFNIVKANSYYCQKKGKLVDELIGYNYFELFPNEINRRLFEEVRDKDSAPKFFDDNLKFPDHNDSSETKFDWKLTPIKDENEVVAGLLISLPDEDHQQKFLGESKNLTYRFIIITVIVIFVSEAVFGFLLHLLPRPFSLLFTTLDAMFMAILIIPLLYIFLLRRMILNISERKKAQDELKKINVKLHAEVKEREQMSQNLEKERKRLYSVLDEIPAAVHLQGNDYRIHFANRYFRERFGDPGGRPCYKILHDHDSPCPNCNAFKVLQNRIPDEAEETHSDGHKYRIYNYPFKDMDGTFLVLQLGIDITEHSRMESALKVSEERLRVMVNSLNDTVFTISRDRKLTQIYGKLVESMGAVPKDFIGKSLGDIFGLQGSFVHQTEVEKAFKGESVVYEWMPALADDIQYIKNSLSPIYDKNGNIEAIVGLARDITQQKMLEKRAIQTEKLMALAELSSMISHEFRNSLTSVRMILELQLESPQLTHSESNSLTVALSSIQHMENVVNHLLNFSRPIPTILKEGDINLVLEESIFFVQAQISKHNINLVRNFESNLPQLKFDPVRMKEVIINLIMNSINAITAKSNPKITPNITVKSKKYKIRKTLRDLPLAINNNYLSDNRSQKKLEIIFAKGVDCILIEIGDNGIGIKPEFIEKIFDPFFTTMPKGTGLGLATVKRTVNEHGGIVCVKSIPMRGSTFRIYLPLNGKKDR